MRKVLSDKAIKNILIFIVLFVISLVYISLLSYSTSPLFPYFYGNDSAHFMTIGKAWLFGKKPYRDLFDHKGPLIYFIDMIGFAISSSSENGILIIQCFFMIGTITGTYKILSMRNLKCWYKCLSILIVLVAMGNNYVEGNSVEEYCLPFLIWSIYGLENWFLGKREEHNPQWALFYGITFGICAMTRVTNAVVLVGELLIISILLFSRGYYKNLIDNILFFIAGFLILTVPFCIYFYNNNALKMMLYDVFFFNVAYSAGCPPWIVNASWEEVSDFFVTYFMYLSLIPVIFIRFYRKDYTLALAYMVTFVCETAIFLSGYSWPQYPLVCLIQVALFLCELDYIFRDRKVIGFAMALMLLAYMSITVVTVVKKFDYIYRHYSVKEDRAWEVLVNRIPENERKELITYGGDDIKELYLLENIVPCCKYYMIQDWISSFSDEIKEDMIKTYEGVPFEWLLTDSDAKISSDYLNENFEMIDSIDGYSLYRKMQNENR